MWLMVTLYINVVNGDKLNKTTPDHVGYIIR